MQITQKGNWLPVFACRINHGFHGLFQILFCFYPNKQVFCIVCYKNRMKPLSLFNSALQTPIQGYFFPKPIHYPQYRNTKLFCGCLQLLLILSQLHSHDGPRSCQGFLPICLLIQSNLLKIIFYTVSLVKFEQFFNFFLVRMDGCFACMYHVHSWYPKREETVQL